MGLVPRPLAATSPRRSLSRPLPMGLPLGMSLGLLWVLLVLVCAGCGLPFGSMAATSPTGPAATASSPEVITRPVVPPAASSDTVPPPYSVAPRRLARLARVFVTRTCAYDARTEGPDDFLHSVRPLATAAELARLAHSGRARLPWPVLRARGERTQISVVGLSTRPTPAHRRRTGSNVPTDSAGRTDSTGSAGWATRTSRTRRVVVVAVRTTRTDFAEVRDFIQLTLSLRRTGSRWRVAAAQGAGL